MLVNGFDTRLSSGVLLFIDVSMHQRQRVNESTSTSQRVNINESTSMRQRKRSTVNGQRSSIREHQHVNVNT
jgi:hypothetical protein